MKVLFGIGSMRMKTIYIEVEINPINSIGEGLQSGALSIIYDKIIAKAETERCIKEWDKTYLKTIEDGDFSKKRASYLAEYQDGEIVRIERKNN